MSDRLKSILDARGIKPLAAFENLNDPSTAMNIKSLFRNYAGIYACINLINGKIYIGCAVTGKIHHRFLRHFRYHLGNKLLAAAISKYNLDNFAFVILEVRPNTITSLTNQELLETETNYITLFKPEYNILQIGGNSFGYKHTDETREKMRANYSDKRREQIGSLNRGKSLSESTRALLREAALRRPPMRSPVLSVTLTLDYYVLLLLTVR